MKLLSRVVWAEGMYLAPQHFQAQNRYFEEAVHFATASLWRDAYGLAACQLDSDALRNGTVSLLNARGMFQDGLPFDIPECDPRPDPRNIVEQFLPATDSLTVGLAVPRWVQGQQNCDLDPIPSGSARYTSTVEMVHDENTGLDAKPVQLGRKNIRLVVLPVEDPNVLTIPIARVMRDQTGHFVYDPTHVAPCLSLSCSERLSLMLQRLVEILEEKSAVVTQERQQTGGAFQNGMSGRGISDRDVGAAGGAVLVSACHQFEPDAVTAHSAGEAPASGRNVSGNVAAGGGAVHVQSGQQSTVAAGL
jgi:type VI secretion system protein ImpJ